MKRYKNLSGNSGVLAYEIEETAIRVKFVDGNTYRYTYKTAGKENVEQMKKLAIAGKGLSGFISKYVKDGYEK